MKLVKFMELQMKNVEIHIVLVLFHSVQYHPCTYEPMIGQGIEIPHPFNCYDETSRIIWSDS